MSSLARRMEIRGMKAMGFRRLKARVVRLPDGGFDLQRVPRGGVIIDPAGKPVGHRWPSRARA